MITRTTTTTHFITLLSSKSQCRYYKLSLFTKRFVGNKPIGHALKVLNALSNKVPTSTNLPISQKSLYIWKLLNAKMQYQNFLSNSTTSTFYVNKNGLAAPSLSSFETIAEKLIVSGLKSIVSGNDPEWVLLNESSALAVEFRKLMLTIFSKVNYHMLNPNYKTLENNIILHLEYVFGNANCLNMSKQLKDIVGEKIISYIQHFMCIIYGRKTFNHEVLKEIADKYTNCTSYENQTSRVLTLMEAFVARKFNAFLKANNVVDFEHHLINSKALPPFFEPLKSIERTQQMHCDSVLISKAIQQYCDIKSFIGLTVIRCRVALFYENKKTCDKLLNELLTTMAKHIKNAKLDTNHILTSLYNKLKNIHIKKTPDRFNEILYELAQVFFNPLYKDLKISFVIDAGIDPTFDKFYEEFLKNKIEFYAKDVDMITFFPSDCSIDEKINEKVKLLIERLFPQEFIEQYEKITWI